ncbi:MAG: phosphoribosyl-AMP cyclohydrolase [Desulfobulbia bacterium]
MKFDERGSKVDIEHGAVFAPKFDSDGLIPAIATDANSGELLMVAYMNYEALSLTLQTKKAHYWSRSRGKIWKKGESSGHTQSVTEILTDCDQDAIWLKVDMSGQGACHVGYRSCFYRSVELSKTGRARPELVFSQVPKVFDPDDVYD